MSRATEATKAAKEKQEADNRLVRAYKQVFGREGNRTDAQKLVWRSLEKQLKAPTSYKDTSSGREFFPEHVARKHENQREFICELFQIVESSEPKQNEQGE
jgi:hypothetical protein